MILQGSGIGKEKMRKKWVMRALWMALMLVSVPGGVLAQSVQDWRLCRAVDADRLFIPAVPRLIEQNKLSQGELLRRKLLRRRMDARIKSGHDGCVLWGTLRS